MSGREEPDRAPATGREDAGDGRSRGLAGRGRLRPDRPAWASTVIPDDIDPLPVVTAAAAARPAQHATSERLHGIDRAWHGHGWPPERAELRRRGAAIRRETLADLDGHLDRLQRMVESHGGTVHHAADAAEARDAVSGVVERIGARLAVKSKSMATEEIHLNRHLEAHDVEVVETDLGEYICQLADERPSHIIAPVVHKSRGDIHALFQQLADDALADEAEALTAFARVRLRKDFAAADVGISGVNFAAADTGTLAIVSNEGNARMVTSRPRVHIAVMPVEKVIPRLTDLGTLLPLLTRSATNQAMSVYQSLLTGPRRADDPDGPDELHLVIVDNGRRRLVGTRYEEVLACIRCGACQVACPVYRTVGGHAYGTVYGGPIGAVLSPLIGDGGHADELPYLSSLCGRCDEVCPVEIPLSDLLVDLRAEHQDGRGATAERTVWRAWAAAWSRPAVYGTVRWAAWLGSHLPQRLQRAVGPARGWSLGRRLPSPRAAGALRRWVRQRSGRHDNGPAKERPASHGGAVTDRAADVAGHGTRMQGTQAPSDEPDADPEALAARFAARLEEVWGEPERCTSPAEAIERAAAIVGSRTAMVDDHPDLGELRSRLRCTDDPDAAEVGVTGVLAAAADTGSLVLAVGPGRPRTTSLVPPEHLAVLRAEQILPTYAEVIEHVAQLDPLPSAVHLVTGPSRSADIELNPVRGVHGPGRVQVLIC